MPNWVAQDLNVVGPKAEIDRFIRVGFVRRKPRETDSVLDFKRLCPLRAGESKGTYSHASGVVLMHFRTRTQAFFSMIISWDYPAAFYARLPKYWPTLAFACTVNEDMRQFGGMIFVRDGVVRNCVRDYFGHYNLREHSREIRVELRKWFQYMTEGRTWRLLFPDAWNHRSMPFDAHFDDDLLFYFYTREELARFSDRCSTKAIMRQTESGWRRARAR